MVIPAERAASSGGTFVPTGALRLSEDSARLGANCGVPRTGRGLLMSFSRIGRLLMSAGVAAGLVAVGSLPAQAGVLAVNGRIAFQRCPGVLLCSIYSMTPTGAGLTQLATGNLNATPAWAGGS